MNVTRRFQGIVAVALFLLSVVSAAQAKYSGGTGEPNDPYQIATAADLIALGEDPNDYDKHLILTADIDLDPSLPDSKVFDKAVIAPDIDPQCGYQGTQFVGVFDGSSHCISHLTVTGVTCVGLFGLLGPGAKVTNLAVVNVNVVGADLYAGALAGCNSGRVVRCSSTGTVSSGYRKVGGLIGYNGRTGTVSLCSSTSTVSGYLEVGGLVGENYGDLTGCHGAGPVSANEYAGGLAAVNYGTVTQCYATGPVSGGSYLGGLVGWNDGTVTRCYSAGAVHDTEKSVGGLMGCNIGSVAQCYSAGAVSGIGSNVGGLVGLDTSNWGAKGVVSTCFWDTLTSGQATSAGGEGNTTAEMQTASTFLEAAWDFVGEAANGTADIWWILEGKSYPRLNWQGPAGMAFVDIPAGTFQMGDHDGVGYSYERPVHTVTLSGFQMSEYETTNAQYAEYLNAAMAGGLIQVVSGAVYASSDSNQAQPYCDTHSASSFSQMEYSQGQFTVLRRDGKDMSDHPVVQVSWYGAKAFCDYYGYRLPTEAEWEYAARDGYYDPYYKYPWGSNVIDCSKANYRNGSSYCNPLNLTLMPYTSPVGYYGAQGAYGLCDMSGGVWEWCQDWCDTSYYRRSPADNPTGPSEGTYRALRGGSWNYTDNYCRVSFRHWNSPDRRTHYYGFRVCR